MEVGLDSLDQDVDLLYGVAVSTNSHFRIGYNNMYLACTFGCIKVYVTTCMLCF